jgi:hypothetical protein
MLGAQQQLAQIFDNRALAEAMLIVRPGVR